ncbi:FkbM family methyltransferase [Mucilaginibacter sp. UYCu711]|uniref:FkbM family methyltransferase n=1 Tax=Mucilaginibacter sp. UYCu711 TaxID=3156339 RepID=UPI003D1DE152
MSLKSLISKILAHNPVSRIVFSLTGKRISFNHLTIRTIAFVLKQRIPFHHVIIDVADNMVTPLTKSLLYYGIYEQKEVDFIKKYLNENDDVIELGSSIGVTGSIISYIQTNGRYISVEADPSLIDANKKNIQLNRKTDYVLINKAIDYFSKTVSFSASKSTLTGQLNRSGSDDSTITVETITLNEICETYEFNNFTLICDIEGAEVTILLNDKNALEKCEKIIIELHDTEYNGKKYLIPDIVDLIIANNFKFLDQNKSVFAFQKNTFAAKKKKSFPE